MKKIIKHVLPFFAFAILALSLSACGKISGSKYKNDKNPNVILSFSNTSEFSLSEDGIEFANGTYTVKGKEIKLVGKMKTPTGDEAFEVTLKILDSKKSKLKDEGGGTWSKI